MITNNKEKIKLKYGRDSSGHKYMYYESSGEKITVTEEMKAENQINDVVELAGKVIVFSDKQSDDLLLELKPILSGDRKEMATSITDVSGRDMRTKTTILRGQPSVIFCQALSGYKDMRELVSRCVNIGVNADPKKIRKVMELQTQRLSGMRIKTSQDVEDHQKIAREIELTFRELEQNPNSYVVSPIEENMIESIYGKTNLVPTDMRDMNNYTKLLELHALYNHENRPSIMIINKVLENGTKHNVKHNQYYFTIGKDYEFLSELVNEFSNTMRSGLPPKAHELLTKVFLNDAYTGKNNESALSMDEIKDAYNEQTGLKKTNEAYR